SRGANRSMMPQPGSFPDAQPDRGTVFHAKVGVVPTY
ncbi:MAG: hypothetical protein ACI8RZ_000678, partial [Myxococcota bacterium]